MSSPLKLELLAESDGPNDGFTTEEQTLREFMIDERNMIALAVYLEKWRYT